MFDKHIKKTIFTLCVDNYAPEITALTYPLIKRYAQKIGADFHVITERKYPEFAPVYEKVQIYDLAQQMENTWNIYIDSDALVHPDTPDWTQFIPLDTVAHNGRDMAPIRWKFDRFFQRDGRKIGSCNWMTFGSYQCIELWKPLDDLTQEEALENINPIVHELNTVVDRKHLIDDYTLSRNIAKYGLKFTTLRDIFQPWGFQDGNWFWHQYTHPGEVKVVMMRQQLINWGIVKPDYFGNNQKLVSEIKNDCLQNTK